VEETPAPARPRGPARPALRGLRLYNAVLLAAAACALPAAAVALGVRRDWRRGLGERLGSVAPTARGRAAVWVHGASVGEVTALGPLVRALRRELPGDRLVLSSLTLTGRAVAATRVPDADARILLPLDLRFTVARALDAVAPRLVLFTETELWPNFFAALAARGIPAVMVSGRLSAEAFARYRRWRWLFAPLLASVRWFCVQSLDSARRLAALGAPPDRIVVTGSLKAAATPPAGALSLGRLGVAERPVLVAGSTHPGEEEAILAAWRRIEAEVAGARLILAPRRPERFEEVAALLAAARVAFARRSALTDAAGGAWPAAAPVLLLDTLGELAGLYEGARLAFVGGTVAPVGGHNLLEPAAQGTAVVFGPHVENAADAAARLLAGGGGVQVRDAAELVARLPKLFADAAAARAAGERARATVPGPEGPLAVTLAVVRAALARPRGAP
jgi:3-deoxy-D-manno-octulosonic-acid transferase